MTTQIQSLTKEIYGVLGMKGIVRMDYIVNDDGIPFWDLFEGFLAFFEWGGAGTHFRYNKKCRRSHVRVWVCARMWLCRR